MLIFLSGCSASLEGLLSAPDQKTFDERLKIHGPVDPSEVSTLKREAQNQDRTRARNAVWLLTLSREPAAEQALEFLGSTTADLQIWSSAAASRLLKQQLGIDGFPKSLERRDMVRLGLKSADAKIYKTAFTLAQRLKLPELQKEIPLALRSRDTEIQALAVAALTPEQARQRIGELHSALRAADYATYPALASALVETRDPKAWEIVATTSGDHPSRLGFINHANFHLTPALHDFMVDRAARHDKFASDAYDILVSQVVQETYPCDPFLMKLTLPRLKAAARSGKRDEDPEILVTIVSRGSNPGKRRPDWNDLLHGQAAVDFAQKWLSAHRN
jgi:hypothetical protein